MEALGVGADQPSHESAQPLARTPGASHLKRLPEYLKDPTVTATKQGGGGRKGALHAQGVWQVRCMRVLAEA